MEENRGIGMEYIMNRLRRSDSSVFVDASTTWGIGEYWGKILLLDIIEGLERLQPRFYCTEGIIRRTGSDLLFRRYAEKEDSCVIHRQHKRAGLVGEGAIVQFCGK